MHIGQSHYDRIVEAGSRPARSGCETDTPIAFDEFLHKQNRKADTAEFSNQALAQPQPLSTQGQELEQHQAPTPVKPEPVETEIHHEVTFRYEIPSNAMTGLLIDMLL